MVQAGVALIDTAGVEGLSVRALARHTHYSSSAVGYWVTPWAEFETDVWKAVVHRLSHDCVIPYLGQHGWTQRSADALLEWADVHPRLARFCVTHVVEPAHFADAFGLDEVIGARGLEPSGEVVSNVHSFGRHVLVALERAMECPERAAAAGMLASDVELEVERARQRLLPARQRQGATADQP
jgi:hypothetical protein